MIVPIGEHQNAEGSSAILHAIEHLTLFKMWVEGTPILKLLIGFVNLQLNFGACYLFRYRMPPLALNLDEHEILCLELL